MSQNKEGFNIEQIAGNFILYIVIFFITSMLIWSMFYWNHDYVFNFLENFYINQNIIDYISQNIKYIITLWFTYLIFLSFIWRKKWKIFSANQSWITNQYGWALLLWYQFVSFFLLLHLKFLFSVNAYPCWIWFQEFLFIIIFLINYSFIVSDKVWKFSTKHSWFLKAYWIILFLIILLPFFYIWYLEIIILLFISSIILPLTHKINWDYIRIYNKPDFLKLVFEQWKKEISELIKELTNTDQKNNKEWYLNIMLLFFFLLPTLISTSFILSIITPIIWILYNFNIFSLVYIHLVFIIIYISLNLISNKFWEYVAVYFNNKEYKWYLLENTEKQLILLTKTNTFVVKHDKIEYIKTLKKR